MASKREGIIRMFDGRMVDVFDLRPSDVVPRNFIHSLSQINRFTGSAPFPISVLAHSYMMERWVRDNRNLYMHGLCWSWDDWYQLRRAVFIHDWEEALFNDLNTPTKKHMPLYRKVADAARDVIFHTLEVDTAWLPWVKKIDKRVYLDEVKSTWGFYPDQDQDRVGLEPLGVEYRESTWRADRDIGYRLFGELFTKFGLNQMVL